MKCRNNIGPLCFQARCRKRRLNLALVFVCLFCVIFLCLVFCVLVFFGYCYFMFSVQVQLIACRDRPMMRGTLKVICNGFSQS